MIAQRIHQDWNISNGVHPIPIVSGTLFKSTLVKSSPKVLLPGNPIHGKREPSDVGKQYLEGIRYLARKKQRRCISQELG
jgi:hypothetical protein